MPFIVRDFQLLKLSAASIVSKGGDNYRKQVETVERQTDCTD